MTDRFMSGWGGAKGKIAKYIVECDNATQADAICKAAENREEMRAINSGNSCPSFPASKYQTTYRHVSQLGGVWLEHMPASELANIKGARHD